MQQLIQPLLHYPKAQQTTPTQICLQSRPLRHLPPMRNQSSRTPQRQPRSFPSRRSARLPTSSSPSCPTCEACVRPRPPGTRLAAAQAQNESASRRCHNTRPSRQTCLLQHPLLLENTARLLDRKVVAYMPLFTFPPRPHSLHLHQTLCPFNRVLPPTRLPQRRQLGRQQQPQLEHQSFKIFRRQY